MLGILHKYNIAIPVLVSNLLTVCPGSFDRRFLGCIHYEGREEDEEFHSFQMKDLMILHKELQQFLTMIGNAHLIDFMVHFSMRNSQIFAQYLKGKMGLQQSLPPEEHEPSVFEGLEHFTPELYEGATAECSDKSRLAIQVSSVFCILYIIYGSKSSCKFIYIQSVKMTSCYSFSHVLIVL